MKKARDIAFDSIFVASLVCAAFLYALFFHKIRHSSCLWNAVDSLKLSSWALLTVFIISLPAIAIINALIKNRSITKALAVAAATGLATYIPVRWFVPNKTLLAAIAAGAAAAGLVVSLVARTLGKRAAKERPLPHEAAIASLAFPLLVKLEHTWHDAGVAAFFALLAAIVVALRLIRAGRFVLAATIAVALWGAFSFLPYVGTPSAKALANQKHRNLILITIDTLRADAIEPYNPKYKTPAFFRLANRSIVFERAFANSPWTMPSLASMFSGLDPRAHGCAEPAHCLSSKLKSLPELAKTEGLDTAAVIYQWHFIVPTGFERGFDRYSLIVCHPLELYRQFFAPVSRLAEELVDGFPPLTELTTVEALNVVASLKQPFFLWIHYFDPHGRYTPPKRFMKYVRKPELPVDLPGHPTGYPEWIDPVTLQRLQPESPPPKPYEVEYVRDMYQAEVLFADEQIGRILDFLDSSGLSKNTYIILTSDHGEEFYEHGSWDHGHTLYNELLHIPLMVSGPGIPRERTSCIVTQTDIFVTASRLLGLSPPPSQGKDLLKVIGRADCERRMVTSATAFAQKKERDAIVAWPYKLISPPMELYRIDDDPYEQHELKAQNIDLAIELKGILQEKVAADYKLFERIGIEPPSNAAKKLQKEVLKAMGYVE